MAIDPLAPTDITTAIGTSEMAAPNRADTLKRLAGQFESMLLSQMLREMESETSHTDGGGYGAPLTDTMYGELGNALVGAGGFGLATSLEDAMARTTPGGDPTAAVVSGQSMPRVYSPWLPQGSTGFALDRERVSSAYGVRRDPISGEQRVHKGVDIPLAQGDDVRSMQDGTVIEADVRGGYGNTVVVDHGNGLTTRYAHLSVLDVAVGQQVSAGQTVGLAGKTGRATGPHLHLEVRQDGVAIDPLGADATRLLGRPVLATETNAFSADDSHGASR